MKVIFHIDFDSFFATVEQQANPRLRGKPIGVTGGDRLTRTVIGAASVEAKKFGVKTGMRISEALKLCPNLILVRGDSDKYLECTKRFLNILKSYSPKLEIFSIDEVFLELPESVSVGNPLSCLPTCLPCDLKDLEYALKESRAHCIRGQPPSTNWLLIAQDIKKRIKEEVGEWITCSIGISYNKMLAKLAGSLYKPDGLVIIEDEEAAQWILDRRELDEVCGIGFRIKRRLNNMGVFNFRDLRQVPLQNLLASFKSYGQVLYNFSRGIDESPVTPFYEKEEVKSIGHRHTINHDTLDPEEIKQILLKLSELIARRLRAKKLVGKTVSLWFRYAFAVPYTQGVYLLHTGGGFVEVGMQVTIAYTDDGLDIFKAGWGIFNKMWDKTSIRMIGISVSNLKPLTPQNLTFLEDIKRREVITKALDNINDKYGEFTLQRGILLNSRKLKRMPNSFLADRRFRI